MEHLHLLLAPTMQDGLRFQIAHSTAQEVQSSELNIVVNRLNRLPRDLRNETEKRRILNTSRLASCLCPHRG